MLFLPNEGVCCHPEILELLSLFLVVLKEADHCVLSMSRVL